MQGAIALPVQLTKQRQRDDAFPAARAAGDHDDLLGVRAPGLLDRMHDKFEGHPLLVEQDELLAIFDLARRQPHQLLDGRAALASSRSAAPAPWSGES